MRSVLAVFCALLLLFSTLSAAPAAAPLLRATLTPPPTAGPATPMPTPQPYPAPAFARATTDPHFSARWDSATSATIQWTQSARGCLHVLHATGERVFIGCYGKWPATMLIELGHVSTDGTARPQSGDVYLLEIQGELWQTTLRGRDVFFPVFRG